MSILKLLASTNYITVNKTLIKELGLEEALIFGVLCSEQTYWESENKLKDGYFFCTVDKIEELTTLSDYKQRKAINHLKEKNYIITKIEGLPATRYFKINEEQVLKLFEISSQKIKELDNKKLKLSNTPISNTPISNKNNFKELHNSESFLRSSKCNKKENLYHKCIALITTFTEDPQLRHCLESYLQLRLQIKDKPIYVNQWKGLLNKLTTLSSDTKTQIQIVNRSIEGGWATFYSISSEYSKNNTVFRDNINLNQSSSEDSSDTDDELSTTVF